MAPASAEKESDPASEPLAVPDRLNWSKLAYDLGLQGLSQEIAVNSVVDSFESNHLCLKLTPELREIVSPAIEQEIRQALESKLDVSCKLEFLAQSKLENETPYEAKNRIKEAHRQAAISVIKESDVVIKLNRAFGTELVESSVRKVDD